MAYNEKLSYARAYYPFSLAGPQTKCGVGDHDIAGFRVVRAIGETFLETEEAIRVY